MNKIKWVNSFAFALVILMCFVIVNSVTFVPEAFGAGSQIETEADIDDDTDISVDNSTIENGDNSSMSSALYKAGDSAKAWQVGYAKFLSAVGFKSTITGTLGYRAVGVISVDQSLTTYRTRYGNGDFYSYSRSTGTRDTKSETFIDANSGYIYYYQNNAKTAYTLSSYQANFGIKPGDFNYVINESTIISEKSFKHKTNGDYEFVFNLTTNGSATAAYSKFINLNGREILGSAMPIFTSIEITLTVNSKGEFKKIYAEDHYYFDILGRITGVSKVTETFSGFKYYEPKEPTWL
ncbi:MAG: hypothetical protein ACLRFG_00380 [Clostridia bacterium]